MMNVLRLRGAVAIALSLGLTLISCGEAGDEPEEPAATPAGEVSEADEDESDSLDPAPEDTFAAQIQDALASSFTEQTGMVVESVACPEAVEPDSQESVECEIQTDEGLTIPVAVETNTEDETLEWKTQGLLNVAALEEDIQTKLREELGLSGVADCGGDERGQRVARADTQFDCRFTPEAGERKTITVQVEDDNGSVSWEFQE